MSYLGRLEGTFWPKYVKREFNRRKAKTISCSLQIQMAARARKILQMSVKPDVGCVKLGT